MNRRAWQWGRAAGTILLAALTTAMGAPSASASEPCVPDPNYWLCSELTPSFGPIGTSVHVEGTLPELDRVGRDYLRHPSFFGLEEYDPDSGCQYFARSEDHRLRYDFDEGVWSADLTVMAGRGACFQMGDQTHRASPGVYDLIIGCHTCPVGEFRLTNASAELPRTGVGQSVALELALSWALISVGVGLRRLRRH